MGPVHEPRTWATCAALTVGVAAVGCTAGDAQSSLRARVEPKADVAADVAGDLQARGVPEGGTVRECPLAMPAPEGGEGPAVWQRRDDELVQCQWGAEDGYYLLAASHPSLSGDDVEALFRSRATAREGVERVEFDDGRVAYVSTTDFAYREGMGQVVEVFGPDDDWYVSIDAPSDSDWLE